MFEQTCVNCGEQFSRSASFCPLCGTPAARGTLNCHYCSREMPATARFCPQCGKPTKGTEKPAVLGNTWARDPSDFATRIEVNDLQGILQRDLIIESGTRAIILFDGRNVHGILGPGRYTLETFGDKLSLKDLRRRATALLVDTGEVDLDLTISDVYTRDPLKLSLDCHLAVEVANPTAFFTNLLKGARSFTLEQLKEYLQDEVQDAAQECIGQRSAAELHASLSHKQEFATHIAAHLDETLRQTGLRFGRVRTMNYRHTRWDELMQEGEEFYLQLSKEEADSQRRKLLFEVMSQKEVQAIAEETQEIAHHEQRVQLRERMRRAVLSDRFSELTSQQEMNQFLREIDRQALIAEDEWDRIQRSIQWQQDDELRERRRNVENRDWTRKVDIEDREQSRAHLLARLRLENDYELKQIELLQQADLSQAELDFALKLERERVKGEQGIEAQRLQFRLDQASQQAAFDREQGRLDGVLRREQVLQDEQQRLALELLSARNAAEIAVVEREQDQLDLEMGVLALEKLKVVRRTDEEGRELLRLRTRETELEMELKAEERRLNMRLEEKRQTFEQQMAREAQVQEFELARIERLKDLPPAAVMAVADPDRGRIIADMKRTEAMQGKSEQEILAMVAENSPEASKALAEIANAGAEGRMTEDQMAFYERLLEQSKVLLQVTEQAAKRVEDSLRTSAEKMQETAHQALGSQREGMVEIARATSHPPAEQQPPTVVVSGSGGAPTAVGGAPGGSPALDSIVCRRCGTKSPLGTRFCANCGQEFFPVGEK